MDIVQIYQSYLSCSHITLHYSDYQSRSFKFLIDSVHECDSEEDDGKAPLRYQEAYDVWKCYMDDYFNKIITNPSDKISPKTLERYKKEIQLSINEYGAYEDSILEKVSELEEFTNTCNREGIMLDVLTIFSRLHNHLPLTALTGKDDEWEEYKDTVVSSWIKTYHNKRCPSVRKHVNTVSGDVNYYHYGIRVAVPESSYLENKFLYAESNNFSWDQYVPGKLGYSGEEKYVTSGSGYEFYKKPIDFPYYPPNTPDIYIFRSGVGKYEVDKAISKEKYDSDHKLGIYNISIIEFETIEERAPIRFNTKGHFILDGNTFIANPERQEEQKKIDREHLLIKKYTTKQERAEIRNKVSVANFYDELLNLAKKREELEKNI